MVDFRSGYAATIPRSLIACSANCSGRCLSSSNEFPASPASHTVRRSRCGNLISSWGRLIFEEKIEARLPVVLRASFAPGEFTSLQDVGGRIVGEVFVIAPRYIP
jgi:hypothetical protein